MSCAVAVAQCIRFTGGGGEKREGGTCCIPGLHRSRRISALPCIPGFRARHCGPIPLEKKERNVMMQRNVIEMGLQE